MALGQLAPHNSAEIQSCKSHVSMLEPQNCPLTPFSQSSPVLWQMVQGKLLPAALLGLGEEGMATAWLFLGALQVVLRNSPEWSRSPELLGKVAAGVATFG